MVNCGQNSGNIIQVEERINAAQQAGHAKRLDYGAAITQGLIQLIDPEEPYLEQLARLLDTRPITEAGLRLVSDPMWGVGQGWFPKLLGGGKTLIKEIQAKSHATSLVISHDIHGAFGLADHMAMLYEGRIVYHGTPEQFRSVDDPLVRQFVEGRMEGPINPIQ
jgi:phosphoglucomutase